MDSHKYDNLDISKKEVLEYLRLVQLRLKNNPKVSGKVRAKFAADIKLIEWFESESDLKYHVSLFLEITDGIRSIIERKHAPELARLNELYKEHVIKKIITPPEMTSELDAMKILAKAKEALRHGAMKE